MRNFPPAEFDRRHDVSDLDPSSRRDSPALSAMIVRLVVLLAITLGLMLAAELLGGMPR